MGKPGTIAFTLDPFKPLDGQVQEFKEDLQKDYKWFAPKEALKEEYKEGKDCSVMAIYVCGATNGGHLNGRTKGASRCGSLATTTVVAGHVYALS